MKKKKRLTLAVVLILLTILPMAVSSIIIALRSVSMMHTMVLGEIEDVAGSAAVVSSPDDCSTPPLDGWGRIGVVSQTTMNSDDVRSIVEELGRRHAVETTAETCRAPWSRGMFRP